MKNWIDALVTVLLGKRRCYLVTVKIAGHGDACAGHTVAGLEVCTRGNISRKSIKNSLLDYCSWVVGRRVSDLTFEVCEYEEV